jgi:Domain of unknown function (DUF397)
MISSEWRKSSASSSNASCVEVRGQGDAVVDVRDSKNPDGPVLSFGPGEWATFVEGVKLGEFDL